MASQIRSTFREILLLLREQIITVTSLDPSRVILTAREDVPHVSAEQDILLVPLDEVPDRENIAAAGRVCNYRTRKVKVVLRSRLVLDQVGQDFVHLTDASLGHLALEDAVCDALEIFTPEDADRNALTACPVRLEGLSRPQPERAAPEWITSSWDLSVEYLRALDQNRQ